MAKKKVVQRRRQLPWFVYSIPPLVFLAFVLAVIGISRLRNNFVEPESVIKPIGPSKSKAFAKELLAIINDARVNDPHPETRRYLQELHGQRTRGTLSIVIEDNYRQEDGKSILGVGGEYIHSTKSKSGKHEIHIFSPVFDQYRGNPEHMRDVIISMVCHEWMHLETYRVYGKMLEEHTDKPGFTEFMVWTNQIRGQLLDWKKQGRFLAPSQQAALAAYGQYYEKDDQAWMRWVQQNLLHSPDH